MREISLKNNQLRIQALGKACATGIAGLALSRYAERAPKYCVLAQDSCKPWSVFYGTSGAAAPDLKTPRSVSVQRHLTRSRKLTYHVH